MRRYTDSTNSIYIVMAALFIVTAVASFAPTSLALISRVYSGEQPLPPPVVHFHAASMTSWLLLLFAQSALVYTGRRNVHRKLGLVALVLAPCIMLSMYGMDLYGLETFDAETTVVGSAVAEPEQAAQVRGFVASILLIHGASYLLFPAFFIWAIWVRRRDNETHKRLMVLATLVLMIPGIGRLLSVTRVLPDFGLNLIDARHLYLVLLIAPAVVYEILRYRVPHRAYLIGLSLLGAWIVAAHFLWTSSWWLDTAPIFLRI